MSDKEKKETAKRTAVKTTYTTSVKNIAKANDVSASLVGKILKSLGAEVCRVLKEQDHFRFASFGSFFVKTLPPRTARNPQTGESIKVGERKKIRFRAGSGFIGPIFGTDESAVSSPPGAEPAAGAASENEDTV